MISEEMILRENNKLFGKSISPLAHFTGTLDSWLTTSVVGGGIVSAKAPSLGGFIQLETGIVAVNDSAKLETFYFIPNHYKRLSITSLIRAENMGAVDVDATLNEIDASLLTADGANGLQFLFHAKTVRTRVGGVNYTYNAIHPRPIKYLLPIQIIWDIEKGYIDTYLNGYLQKRFTGSEVPDPSLSYRYWEYIVTKNTATNRILKNLKLELNFEL